ncbi:hypothetical protein CYMTET_43785 [Cymbomonas tetramitiformis]|uniref:Poly [ADP-ribose] polymerase n=1 Tax=Cymbomonas tetramitiformis TaxID=36881 RepID=A0AAE0EZY5_9CHLO|nr:hypothetical protein CYMTET_43785 [Cymbomonas tetramitiformis]
MEKSTSGFLDASPTPSSPKSVDPGVLSSCQAWDVPGCDWWPSVKRTLRTLLDKPSKVNLSPLNPESKEYQGISEAFLHSSKKYGFEVTNIERIENKTLVAMMESSVRILLSRQEICNHKCAANVRLLFHTTSLPVENICQMGLDVRAAQSMHKAGNFGSGVYFASNPVKCDMYWKGGGANSKELLDGHASTHRYMLLCMVALGRPHKFPQNHRNPRLTQAPMGFDSVKGTLEAGSHLYDEYVVYNPGQCCPLFAIHYTVPSPKAERDVYWLNYMSAYTAVYQQAQASGLGKAEAKAQAMRLAGAAHPSQGQLQHQAASGATNASGKVSLPRILLGNHKGIEKTSTSCLHEGATWSQPDGPREGLLEQITGCLVEDFAFPSEQHTCTICLDSLVRAAVLPCSHSFCVGCLLEMPSMRPDGGGQPHLSCPLCSRIYGVRCGNQPVEGVSWTESLSRMPLVSYPDSATIRVECSFANGIQGPEHSHPGEAYTGKHCCFYLPANEEGRDVLRRLRVSWRRRLLFTVGQSTSSGRDNMVIFSSIHLKTSNIPGASHGYPDTTYLTRVQEELAAVGITSAYDQATEESIAAAGMHQLGEAELYTMCPVAPSRREESPDAASADVTDLAQMAAAGLGPRCSVNQLLRAVHEGSGAADEVTVDGRVLLENLRVLCTGVSTERTRLDHVLQDWKRGLIRRDEFHEKVLEAVGREVFQKALRQCIRQQHTSTQRGPTCTASTGQVPHTGTLQPQPPQLKPPSQSGRHNTNHREAVHKQASQRAGSLTFASTRLEGARVAAAPMEVGGSGAARGGVPSPRPPLMDRSNSSSSSSSVAGALRTRRQGGGGANSATSDIAVGKSGQRGAAAAMTASQAINLQRHNSATQSTEYDSKRNQENVPAKHSRPLSHRPELSTNNMSVKIARGPKTHREASSVRSANSENVSAEGCPVSASLRRRRAAVPQERSALKRSTTS